MTKNQFTKTNEFTDIITKILEKPLCTTSREHKFSRPIEEDLIYKRLAPTERHRSIKSYLGEISKLTPEYIKTLLTFNKCNPSNKHVCSAVDSLTDNSEFIKLERELNKSIKAKRVRVLNIIGEKGLGKTTLINNYFNKNNENLFDQGFLWFRIDASTVYSNWEDYLEITNNNNLLERFILIKFCLICFTSHSNKLFKDIQNNPNGTYLPFFKYKDNLAIDFEKLLSDANNFSDLKSIYKKYQDKFDIIVELFKSLKSYFSKQKKQLILVIDGLDNVHFRDKINLYVEILKMLKSFLFVDDSFNAFNKVIVCFRKPTLEHFRCFIQASNNLNGCIKNYDLIWDNPLPIVLNKNKLMTQPLQYFQKDYDGLIDDDIKLKIPRHEDKKKECFHSLENFIKTYLVKLVRLIERTALENPFWEHHTRKLVDLIRENESPEMWLEEIFYCNFRNYLLNLNYAFQYHLVHEDINQRITSKVHIMEQFILRGKTFFSSTHFSNTDDRGLIFPNIFYYSKSNEIKNWHGLCGLRILQLVHKKKTPGIHWKNIITILKDLFNYDNEIVDECLHELIKHRLLILNFDMPENKKLNTLDDETDALEEETDTSEKDYLDLRKVKISNKGLLAVPMIFKEISIMYYFSLDTPMPSNLIGNSNVIRTHANTLNKGPWKGGYLEAEIISSLTLLRLIRTQHISEIKTLKNKDTELNENQISLSTFDLSDDIFNNYSKVVSEILNGITNNYRKNEILKDLKGIISRKNK